MKITDGMQIYIDKRSDYLNICDKLDKMWYTWQSGHQLTQLLYLSKIGLGWITIYLYNKQKRVWMQSGKWTWAHLAKNILNIYTL